MNPILLFILGLILLTYGGEILVTGSSNLAKKLNISPLIIGLTIVAFGTSSPELAVSLKSSVMGNNDIAIGNVVGSNIFNFMFILGLSSLIKPLTVRQEFFKLDIPAMLVSAVLLTVLSIDRKISFIDGLIFTLTAIVYFTLLLKNNSSDIASEHKNNEEKHDSNLKIVFYLIGGLAFLVLGSNWLVEGAISIAKSFNISDRVIALTIVAAGTSMPELVTSIIASKKGETEIAIGNVIGSNILNILIILGLSSLISKEGLQVQENIFSFDMMVMSVMSIIAYPLLKFKMKITRPVGFILLAGFVSYTLYLLKS